MSIFAGTNARCRLDVLSSSFKSPWGKVLSEPKSFLSVQALVPSHSFPTGRSPCLFRFASRDSQDRGPNTAVAGAKLGALHGGRESAFATPAFQTPTAAASMRLNGGGGGGESVIGGVGVSQVGRGPSAAFDGVRNARVGAAAAGRMKSGRDRGDGRGGSSEGIGHLLNLGARLGAFFPAAIGPGPVPGLEQLLHEASDAVATVERYPPTPGYKYGGPAFHEGGAVDGGPASVAHDESSMVGGLGSRFLATPGLTPIPTAITPGFGGVDAGGDGGGGDAPGEEDTPSMLLTGLLRGSPGIGAAGRIGAIGAGQGVGAMSMRDAAGQQQEDERGVGPGSMAGARATRMAAAGLGGPPTSGSARERTPGVTAGGEGAGGGGRATRGAGGRRVGGRLSFSSAIGIDDGSEEGESSGPGAGEDRTRAVGRIQRR